MEKVIVTIARQYGSGGKTIGQMLAKDLGIKAYSREILKLASEDSGINETLFNKADEKLKKTNLFGIMKREYKGELIPPESEDFTSNENLFNYQAKIIKNLAQEESCVIIGRCSEILVEDGFHVFICAGMKKRVERMLALEPQETAKKMENRMRQIDQKRRDYYQYYSGNEWGNPRNYHLSLNSGKLGIEKCVDMILESLKLYEQ